MGRQRRRRRVCRYKIALLLILDTPFSIMPSQVDGCNIGRSGDSELDRGEADGRRGCFDDTTCLILQA